MFRSNHFAQQNRTGSPFAPESQSHQRARRKQLLEILRQPRQEGEHREPQDCHLQRSHAAVAIRQPSRQPSAHCRDQQRRCSQGASLCSRDPPDRDQRGNHEAVELDVHRIQRPAACARYKRPPFCSCKSG